jgi:hypothetical protein
MQKVPANKLLYKEIELEIKLTNLICQLEIYDPTLNFFQLGNGIDQLIYLLHPTSYFIMKYVEKKLINLIY